MMCDYSHLHDAFAKRCISSFLEKYFLTRKFNLIQFKKCHIQAEVDKVLP
jgi:hypothetical protein